MSMSTTLTIRNLEAPVKHKLRVQAASHGRSMEAEAREILMMAVTKTGKGTAVVTNPGSGRRKSVCQSVRGIWKGRMTTDEIMKLTRGE